MPNGSNSRAQGCCRRIHKSLCQAIRFWFIAFPLILASAGDSSSQTTVINPQELVRHVVENELRARLNEPIYWRYFSQTQEGDESRTRIIIESRKWTLTRILSRNSLPLNPNELKQEDNRIRDPIRRPRNLEKEQSEQMEDLQKAQSLFRMLPDAFIFTLDSSDEQTIRLSFRPNPSFKPPTAESTIFRVVEGNMMVDRGQNRLVELRGVLSRDFELGLIFFGKLNKGSCLELRQQQVESGHWVATSYNLQLTGRAWFFKTICRQRKESFWGFQPVPGSLTLEEAAEISKVTVPDLTAGKNHSAESF